MENFIMCKLLVLFGANICMADSKTWYVSKVTGIAGTCTCPCIEMRDSYCRYRSGSCYQPICPVGTYLCCVFCRFSTCAMQTDMAESVRGIRECIVCPPGHFCDGCDVPTSCPDSTVNPNAGMSRRSDCVKCPLGLIPNVARTTCCYNGPECTNLKDEGNYLAGAELSWTSSAVTGILEAWFWIVVPFI
jgi:hypothetical protein